MLLSRRLAIVASPLFCLALSHSAQAEDSDPSTHRGTRILAETGGAVGGGALGALAGSLVGTVVVGHGPDKIESALIGAGIGGFAGAGAGIYLAGRAADGNGTYWATLGGATLGTLPGLLTLLVTRNATANNIAIVSLFVLPVVGGITGYELSTKKKESTSSTSAGLESAPASTPLILSWGAAF